MVQASPRGRPMSWLGVVLMFLTFGVGCLGLVLGSWLVFWIGAGLFVAAGLFALANGILSDVH